MTVTCVCKNCMFQASKKPYHHYNDFLDCVENYETELEENRVLEAIKIANKYLTKPPKLSSKAFPIITPNTKMLKLYMKIPSSCSVKC